MFTDEGRPFFVNESSGATQWELPELEANNVQYPWREMVSDEGTKYYWNEKTNETLWDIPSAGGCAKGAQYGRWTECVGKGGHYFFDEVTNETCWEISEKEMEEIIEASNQKKDYDANKSKYDGPHASAASRRTSGLLRAAELESLRKERLAIDREKAELELLRSQLLSSPSTVVHLSPPPPSRTPAPPSCPPPTVRRSSVVLATSGAGIMKRGPGARLPGPTPGSSKSTHANRRSSISAPSFSASKKGGGGREESHKSHKVRA